MRTRTSQHPTIRRTEQRALRNEHAGRCALCGREAELVLDHDHQTGLVRAFLCAQCNHGLGCFRDDPDLLVRAARYLRYFADHPSERRYQPASRPRSPNTMTIREFLREGIQPTGDVITVVDARKKDKVLGHFYPGITAWTTQGLTPLEAPDGSRVVVPTEDVDLAIESGFRPVRIAKGRRQPPVDMTPLLTHHAGLLAWLEADGSSGSPPIEPTNQDV